MKRLVLTTMFFIFVSACGGGDSSSSLTIYGTTGDSAASAGISTAVKNGFAKDATTFEGSPTSLKIEQYELWVSSNSNCSNPVLVRDYGSTPQTFDMAQGPVSMFSASPADGTYNCIIFKMGSVIEFTPDSTAAAAFSSCTETEHSFDLFLEGNTFKDINGNDVAGQGTKLVPVDDAMYIFASTDLSAIPSATAHEYQKLAMNTALTVPGNSYMIMNFDNLIYEDTDTGTAICWVEAPVMGFSSTPSVDAIKSWQGCVSSSETVTSSATSGGNLVHLGLNALLAQYYGGGDANIAYSSDSASWTDFSGAMASRSVGSAMAAELSNTIYLAAAVASPIPGIYIQSYNGNSWSDFSNQLTGFTAYNMYFKRDLTYFYISYSGTSASGPIRVFRLPLDGSSSDWEVIGLDIATTTSHAYELSASGQGEYVYVTDTSSGLSVKKYIGNANEWEAVGDPLSTTAIESHDMHNAYGTIFVAWTLPDSYELNAAMYTNASGWQALRAPSLSGIRASSVKIAYVGSTIYLLYKDVDNAGAITVLSTTLGGDGLWAPLPSTIEANGPTIYDFAVVGQTPRVLYSHTASGQTPLLCEKFATTR